MKQSIAVLGLALLASTAASAQTYGYKKEEDPLIIGVKTAIALARSGDKQGLSRTIGELKWQTEELKKDIRVDLDKTIDAAVKSGSPSRIAYALTQLVFQALRQKFYWNEKERLEKLVPARARIDSAQYYYEAILSHAVRRADRSTDSDRHRKIMKHLREMRASLGSSGLFGLGGKGSDVAAFRRHAREVEKLLREVYPDFIGAEEDESRQERDECGSHGW